MIETLHRLYEQGILKTCAPTQDINSYSYEFMGRMVHQRVTVDPRLGKADLVAIAKRATQGSIADMINIAMMYNTGYGVPYEPALAVAWSKFATLLAAEIHFVNACAKLKDHVYACPAVNYPDSLIAPCVDVIEQIEGIEETNQLPVGVFVSPEYEGIPVFCIYRNVPGEAPNLYVAFYKIADDFYIASAKLTELGVLSKFAPSENVELLDYSPFGQNAMYVVSGYICSDDPVVQVFDEFLNSAQPVRSREAFNNDDFVAGLQLAERELVRVERLIERQLESGQNVPVRHRNEYHHAKESVARRKVELANSDPEKDYQEYIKRLPISRLKYITTDVHRWNYAGLKTVNIQRVNDTTFECESYPALKIVGAVVSADIQETVNLLEENGCKVKSLALKQLNGVSASDVKRFTL